MAQTENPRQKKKKPNEGSVQAYLEIAEIRDDLLVMKDGSLRAVLITSSINFNLKSIEEQEGIIANYQNFINSLNFPLQILIRSKKLILDSYLFKVKGRIDKEKSPFIKTKLEEYQQLLKSFLDISNIMDKKFYVIIPFFSSPVDPVKSKLGLFEKIGSALNPTYKQTKKEEEFQTHKAQIKERVGLIIDGLSAMELDAIQLSTIELIELFYEIYNHETAQREKILDISSITANIIKR